MSCGLESHSRATGARPCKCMESAFSALQIHPRTAMEAEAEAEGSEGSEGSENEEGPDVGDAIDSAGFGTARHVCADGCASFFCSHLSAFVFSRL